MKSVWFLPVLCIAGALSAQTTPAPAAPTPQPQKEEKSTHKTHRTVTSFWPAVSAANTAGGLTPGQKFKLFGYNTVNPFPIASAAAIAGVSQARNSNPGYGQGGEGYGKRFGAAYANNASTQFFGTFLYPTLFRQDPRYFRKETGSAGSRIGYSLTRLFVTRTDSGRSAPNISLWLATASSAALSNTYYPAGNRSAGDAADRFGISFGTQAGFNLLKEFWPDIKRKVFKKGD
jgi:hypothetical protein